MKYVYTHQCTLSVKSFLDRYAELAYSRPIVANPDELHIFAHDPAVSFIISPHWPNIVQQAFLEVRACVGFHMAYVPYRRGECRSQSLIVRSKIAAMISVQRMTAKVYAEQVDVKEPLFVVAPRKKQLKGCRRSFST